MRAAVYHAPGDVRVGEVPKPDLDSPTDATVRVPHTAVRGSDPWSSRGESDRDSPSCVGHEPMGIAEAVAA